MNKKKEHIYSYIKLIIIEIVAIMFGEFFSMTDIPETNIVVMYILAVFLVARFTSGYRYGILSALISMVSFNYFFTQPYYTLKVNDLSYLVTFSIMLITSILTSTLTTKEKLVSENYREKEKESWILYMLSSKLSDATDIETVLKIATESISHLFHVNVGCIYIGYNSESIYIQQLEEKQICRNVYCVDNILEKYQNLNIEFIEEKESYGYPINGRNRLLAVVKIGKDVDVEYLKEKKELLHLIIDNVSVVIDRIEATIERDRDRESMEIERERANLLRAISHDLRTPLSGIMGTSEILMDMTDKEDGRQKLFQEIYQDADWLKSLVENILSLTRLQNGKIVVNKEMEAIEEVVGSAVAHIERSYPGREIHVYTLEDFLLVPMDARLIEQVITNLLDNAIKHTTPQEEITVAIRYTNDYVEVTISDEGKGIDETDIQGMFNLFYTSRTRSADSKSGIGLGLTICKTVVEAHGGIITGGNRINKKGAEFVFTLPLIKGEI